MDHFSSSTNAPAAALTPPTSEDNDVKLETQSTSDLSEVHDEEEEEEIVPDHYYDGGKIPVFKPTMEQFRSFKDYVERIDKYGMKAGIVKVIPPPEWRQSLPKLDDLVKTIKIKNPITQEFMGTHGIYTQANIEKQRSYNLPEWKNLTEEPQNQPPARRGERRRGQEKIVRGGGNPKPKTAAPKPAPAPPQPGVKRGRGRPRKYPLPTPAPADETERKEEPAHEIKEEPEEIQETVEKSSPAPKQKKARGRQPKGDTKKSVSSRRMNNQTETADVIDEAAFQDFDFRLHSLDEFTPERCKELETAYWKSLIFAQPMYAADMPGSLFTDDVTSWNVAKLENLLDVLGTKVPGVNTAYLYMGMWKATFAWHLEDVDLYSINYIHFGAPKQWYSISQEDARKFEAAMKNVWPNDSKNCDQFLRHKTYLISPQLLKERFNIEVNRLVHHEGEFVITYPYGYHSGYNLGYNCAESVNFALESWLDFGRIARKCECEADSVWVDVSEIERKLRGEPTPEYYEETDDDEDEEMEEAGDLPTPPASVKGKPGRKRKRDAKDKGEDKPKKKKIKIRIKTAMREPCALCPNDAMYEPLLPTDNGRKAHRSCALYTPETYLSIENGVEMVLGVNGIDKARLELKCNFCRSKRGACFQCASRKCTRAFHATCAAAAGVQIDAGPVPTFGEDGTEYFEEGFDFRCKFHRPRRPKNLDPDTLEHSKLVNNYAKTLHPQDVVQAQLLGGEIFAGLVVENRPSELAVLVDVLPDGDRVEVEWKWLVVLNPDDSQRPKPSAAAIPMPPDMNKKSVSIENRQDGVPAVDETFTEGGVHKWAEFCNLTQPPQGYRPGVIGNKEQIKVDLSKASQLYFYLGEISTEGKSKFTDDLSSRTHVTSADFMERVKPPPQPRSSTVGTHKQQAASSVGAPARPYSYKPKVAPQNPQSSTASIGNALQNQTQNPFPADAYYSTTTLPAAFPGRYSAYTNHVRQNSGDQTSARRLSMTGQLAHIAPRPPTAGHSHPVLNNGGGLQPAAELSSTTGYRPPSGSGGPQRGTESIPGRDSNVQWTPPSQVFQSHGLDRTNLGTGLSSLNRPAPLSNTVRDMHQQLAQQTQTSQFYRNIWPNGYVPHTYKMTAPMGPGPVESPRQPTQSPLSEKDTPA
ncbi:JmjC-domain-containing protein [Myriangium duriaei CBS 260.36]|uniref:[histone H3]-trimethyl-L-lysine(9) demethylase n=1 Tax=Myriangium duriaei CBS 260.36 TaxID=1168546 RepID=A0A9P4MIM4_9PEZI|nr:JmjC-domain-containing protein [Myriangium duriaei CBS 260.36]